ncbi:MAG: DUF222 domain-containing protein, partial [Candidatus Nanopelagicales bacterium]
MFDLRSRPAPERSPWLNAQLSFGVPEGLLRQWWLADKPGWVNPEWYEPDVRPEVRALLDAPPGPELIAALAEVPGGTCPIDHDGEQPSGMPAPGRAAGHPCVCQLVVAAAWEACSSWTSAQAARAVVDVAGPAEVVWDTGTGRRGECVVDAAREELAPALRLSTGSAANRIRAAREFAACPEVAELVDEGHLPFWGARLIAGDLSQLAEPDDRRQVGAALGGRVRDRACQGRRPWTSGEQGQVVAHLLLSLGPEALLETRKRARRGRRIEKLQGSHGMATLTGHMDAVDAERIYNRLSALAAGLGDDADRHDDRSMDARRADVFVDLLLGAGAPKTDTQGSGQTVVPKPEIGVIVCLPTLLGLSEEPGCVHGLGPIDADMARALAADGSWRLWVTDPDTGGIAAVGSRTYRPSAAVARLVRAREPHCRMPGCRRAAAHCDLDHVIPFPQGPGTTPDNLGPLCRRHHLLKTHFGF